MSSSALTLCGARVVEGRGLEGQPVQVSLTVNEKGMRALDSTLALPPRRLNLSRALRASCVFFRMRLVQMSTKMIMRCFFFFFEGGKKRKTRTYPGLIRRPEHLQCPALPLSYASIL